METGMITQLDDISLKVLNYISNKNFYWIIEDLKSVADVWCFLLYRVIGNNQEGMPAGML